jgi:DNA-directed RNA polymerase specialized sigma24 family protein
LWILLLPESDIMTSIDRPTAQDLDQMAEALSPRIEELLQRYGCPPETAEEVVREALVALTYRWSRIGSREWWLLDRIEKALRRNLNRSGEEPSP